MPYTVCESIEDKALYFYISFQEDDGRTYYKPVVPVIQYYGPLKGKRVLEARGTAIPLQTLEEWGLCPRPATKGEVNDYRQGGRIRYRNGA